jgi:hypothetical protein
VQNIPEIGPEELHSSVIGTGQDGADVVGAGVVEGVGAGVGAGVWHAIVNVIIHKNTFQKPSAMTIQRELKMSLYLDWLQFS